MRINSLASELKNSLQVHLGILGWSLEAINVVSLDYSRWKINSIL